MCLCYLTTMKSYHMCFIISTRERRFCFYACEWIDEIACNISINKIFQRQLAAQTGSRRNTWGWSLTGIGNHPMQKTVSQSDGTDFCPAPEPFPVNPLWHRRCPINRAETQRATGKATMQATGRAEMGAMGRVAMRTTGREEMQARGSQRCEPRARQQWGPWVSQQLG